MVKQEALSVQTVWQGYGRETFTAGATIYAEGETGSVAFILLRGDVTLHTGGGTGRQRALTKLKPGQMFGMHAFMAGARRGATASTKHGCDVMRVSEETLKRKLGEADPFIRYWIDYLSKRIVDLSAP